MDGRVRACFIATAIALVALQSCGAGSGNGGTGPRAGPSKVGRGIALKQIGSFEEPVYIDGAPGFPKLLFVVEKPGRVAVLRNGHRLSHPFLDISGRVSLEGERGLLSIAFPPDYKQTRRFYVYYTDRQGDIRVDEFRRRKPTRAAAGSRRSVIEIPHREFTNHNGGQLQFLGNLLYFGTGDGGLFGDPHNNAQNKDVLLGKLLRIDPLPSHGRPYSVPSGNPFAGPTPGRGEIYSYGLRNPFRFSFDRITAGRPRIAIGDVGQGRFEELDYLTVAKAAGANFGWDAFEGFSRYEEANGETPDPGGTVKPIFVYPHSRGGSCAIIGGVVVRDKRLGSLYRHYVYADLCEGRLRSLVPHLHRASGDHLLGPTVASPSSFGEDDSGRVYVASLDGPVYRLVAR
jgi:hypothetical protein